MNPEFPAISIGTTPSAPICKAILIENKRNRHLWLQWEWKCPDSRGMMKLLVLFFPWLGKALALEQTAQTEYMFFKVHRHPLGSHPQLGHHTIEELNRIRFIRTNRGILQTPNPCDSYISSIYFRIFLFNRDRIA